MLFLALKHFAPFYTRMNTASFYKTVFEILIFVKNILYVVFSTGTTVTLRLFDASRVREYIFLNGYTTPFLSHQVKTTLPGVPEVTWTYNLDTNILRRDDAAPLKNMPWLSGSIRYNGMKLYCLDDFIGTVKYSNSRDEPPPPAVIVGAWSLYTGIVLNNQLNMELSVITDEGEVLVFSPWSFDRREISPNTPSRFQNLYIEAGPVERIISATPLPVMHDIEFEDYLPNDLDDMPPLM